MSNIIKFLILILLLSSCAGVQQKESRLEGVWVSDREKTLEELGIDPALSQSQLDYLNKNLGELRFAFKANKTAVFLKSQPNYEPIWEDFKITDAKANTVSIKTSRGVEATYHFQDTCFYLINDTWGYKEYFCKSK